MQKVVKPEIVIDLGKLFFSREFQELIDKITLQNLIKKDISKNLKYMTEDNYHEN